MKTLINNIIIVQNFKYNASTCTVLQKDLISYMCIIRRVPDWREQTAIWKSLVPNATTQCVDI